MTISHANRTWPIGQQAKVKSMAKKIVKAAHGDHTGRPSVQALNKKVTDAIQEDPRFDTDHHGQPEGSPGDVEPFCFDVTVPDDKGKMMAIIHKDDGTCVKHGFTYDGENVTLDPGAPMETECTQVYAEAIEKYKDIVKAAGTADGAKKGAATNATKAATAASSAAHQASAAAHESATDDDHEAAKVAHEAASAAHSKAMIAHAKAGNTEAANDHAKAMTAHDACADAHCRKDSEAVEAASTEYVGKFVKAGGPGSGRHHVEMSDEADKKEYERVDKEAMQSTSDARNATDKAKFSGQAEDHRMAALKHGEASLAHEDAAKAARNIGDEQAYRVHHDYAEMHFATQNEHETSGPTNASGTEATKGLVRCEMSTTEFDPALPTSEFMWMPAGTHMIQASYDDKPARLCVTCDPEKTVNTVKASFERIVANAQGRPPFGDINHKEVEAAFWPQDFVAHEDGVYCKAEWSELGLKCVRGKTFRSFSPCFSCDAEWVKAVDNGQGVLVFPEGVRGSASNPARVTGISNKSVGSLTNWPAFKAILPVKASQVEPQPGTTKPADNNGNNTNMKTEIKFVKASSDGKYAAGIVASLESDIAAPYVQAGEAAAPQLADVVIRMQAERERQAATDKTLIRQAIVRATERGALKKPVDGKDSDEMTAAIVKAESYLKNGVPICDVVDLIDSRPGTVKAEDTKLGAKAGLFVRATASTEKGGGLIIGGGTESVQEACEGILKAYEPVTGDVNGYKGLVRAGRVDEAIEASRVIANKYKTAIVPVLKSGEDFALRDMVKAADTQDPNGNLGTIATGILLMRDLGFLRSKLVPFHMATTDLSAEPVKFNQQIITRYKTPPPVLTFVKGVGYTLNANDTTRKPSTPSTTDVPINMQQNKAVCIQFDNVLLGSTMRALFGEQQAMQFYSLAKAINKHYISTMIAANWTPLTEAGTPLNAPKFNATGWNIPSLVAIKNKMTLAQIPDDERIVMLHSYFHDILMQDSNLLTAYVIKAALAAQTNPNIDTFGQTELPELFGLDIHETQLFSDQPYQDTGWSPTVFGMAGTKSASLFVTRIPNDYNTAFPDIPATAAIQVVTEPDSNMSMLFSKWVDNAAKVTNAECAVMYQAAQGDPRQGFLLGTVSGAQN